MKRRKNSKRRKKPITPDVEQQLVTVASASGWRMFAACVCLCLCRWSTQDQVHHRPRLHRVLSCTHHPDVEQQTVSSALCRRMFAALVFLCACAYSRACIVRAIISSLLPQTRRDCGCAEKTARWPTQEARGLCGKNGARADAGGPWWSTPSTCGWDPGRNPWRALCHHERTKRRTDSPTSRQSLRACPTPTATGVTSTTTLTSISQASAEGRS